LVVVSTGLMELTAVSLAALLLLLSDLRPAGAGAAYTLHYFAARGKAEPIRLLLNELQLDYTEIRYTRPPVTGNMMNWEEEKPEGIASGLFPFGQLPVLTHIHRPVLLQQGKEGGVVSMAQSGAIMNYIGRQHSMYGKDIFQDMRIDEMIGGIGDLKAKWRDRFYGKETAEDLAAALLLWREEVPTWLSFIGTLKKKHGGRWMVGDELTLADFYAFEALDGAMRYALPRLLSHLVTSPDLSFSRTFSAAWSEV
jgi:glutathione S-transferase